MQWEQALEMANELDVQVKQAAYELSYRYLDEGPGRLAAREGQLRQVVAALPPGAALPTELGRDLFAWQNAVYMARRRASWYLPPAWRTDQGAGGNPARPTRRGSPKPTPALPGPPTAAVPTQCRFRSPVVMVAAKQRGSP